MNKLSIGDLDLAGKRVFIRVDFNVPLEGGVITNDTRIRAALPTIRLALDGGAVVVLASHLGRPKGTRKLEYSLKPVATRLAELLGRPVEFAEDCIGAPAEAAVERARQPAAGEGGVVLLENLRFHAAEEQDDPAFADSLARLADLYVNDAFGAAHRAHASVHAIAARVPQAAAGLLMQKELEYLGRALESPDRPFVAILGGAKVSDKLEVIENLLERVDRLLIGGAMAYTFFKARGLPVGRSLVEDDRVSAARNVLDRAGERGVTLALPEDHLVADKPASGQAAALLAVGDEAIGDRMGLDIGPATVERFSALLADASTVVWNGPMGVFEIPEFAAGTAGIARAVAKVAGTTIVGGGDSIAAVAQAGVADRISHISTGGGASLELLGGRRLPGVEALTDK